ncbi:unnamed protein product [Symbiodinium natans]|uniref:Uncharacterized protein n=1 Tax=Symbiodinium natans TaxID=878477 RepID=A0A812ICM7_9DINO|nr:unnamed protein product [Symbiodinium natans]
MALTLPYMADTEEELALLDWVNACHPDAEAEEFDDLADGSILADVLRLYAPDVDPSNTAAGSAKLLHGCLSAYFGSRLALPRLAGNMHNGTFCKPGLLRALCEAVMLAAVEGPRKEEAIQAIMNLEEPQQLALGSSLQRLMADAPEYSPGEHGSLSRQGTDASLTDSGPPTPRADQSLYKSEADILHDELQDMRNRLSSEEMAISGLESSQKSLEAQLRTVMIDYTAEEEQAAETDALLQKWQRSHGEDLRQFKAECDALRADLDRETEHWQDLPQRQAKLRKQLKMEVDAFRDLQDKTGNLEVEIRQAAQSSANDDVSTVKAEMMTSQMQQNVVDRMLRRAENEEKEEIRLAKSLWEDFHVAEVTAQAKEDSYRQLRRVAEKEEESELDVVGLLEFRESEMRQLEQAMAEMDSTSSPSQISQRPSVSCDVPFTRRSSMRASISGPPGAGTAELLRGLPDLQERRKLLKELASTSRAQSTWQAELQQQQQRTRELEYRLQQLSDEAAQLHSSEAKALTELGVRKEEEQKCATEFRERDHLVQAEVRRANLEKDQMNGVRRTGQQAAELQRELAAARSELQSQQEAKDEKSQQLSDLKEETEATESESAQLRQQREEQAQVLAQRAQSSAVKMQSEAVAEELQQAQRCLHALQQDLGGEEAESTRLQTLQQNLSEEQQHIEEQAQRVKAQQQQLELQKAALQTRREVLADLKREAEKQEELSVIDAEPTRSLPTLQKTVAPMQALTPEQAGTAAAAAARLESKAVEDQSAAAAEAAAAAAEAQGASPEQRAAAAAGAAGAAAAAAARAEKKPRADQVAAAAAAASKAAEAAGATKAQHAAAASAAAGAAAAAAERAAGKSSDQQATAAARAAVETASKRGATEDEKQDAAAGAAGSAALLAAKMTGKSKKEQLAAAARAAAAAAAQEGALPGNCSEAAQAAALRAAAKLGVPEDQAQDIACNVANVANMANTVTPKQEENALQLPANPKGGKAALKKLRLELAAQEGKMRQTEAASAERREAMRRETQLLADSLREVGLRCHMLLGKHKMLLDDRKRLESEA